MRTIPTITKNLLIINVMIFLVNYIAGADAYGNLRLNDTFGLHFFWHPTSTFTS